MVPAEKNVEVKITDAINALGTVYVLRESYIDFQSRSDGYASNHSITVLTKEIR
jgi:hypothetical protein